MSNRKIQLKAFDEIKHLLSTKYGIKFPPDEVQEDSKNIWNQAKIQCENDLLNSVFKLFDFCGPESEI